MIRPLALLLFTLSPLRVSAENGTTAAAFLQNPLGAQAAGMGGAFAAVSGSLDSLQYNPAALATLRAKTLTSTYLSGFGSTNYGFLGYGHPFRYGTLAAGAMYYNAGTIDLNLSNGTQGNVTAEENTAWTLSYAARPLPELALGATYRFLRMNLAQTAQATSSQADLGFLWNSPLRGLTLGGAYQYLGPDIRFENAGDPSPRTLRYGLSYHFPDLDAMRADPSVDLEAFDMTLAADMVQVLRQNNSPRLGSEFGISPALLTRVAIRFGWIFGNDTQSFTFGVGFQQGRFHLDYSFGPAKDLGNLQQITLGVHF